MNLRLRSLLFPCMLIIVHLLGGCVDGSDYGDDSDIPSGEGTHASQLIGTWNLVDPAPDPVVSTISFDGRGRGANVIDGAGIYQSERRSYDYRVDGDKLYFRYDEVGTWGAPSTIVSLTSSRLRLYHADNTTGTYERINAGGGGGSGGQDDGPSIQSGVCFWSRIGNEGDIRISVDGIHRGTLRHYWRDHTPQYGQADTVTVTLDPGTYHLDAESEAGTVWNGRFTISPQTQLLYELTR